MSASQPGGRAYSAVTDAIATARGAAHRDDPVTLRVGGPAGNARLTAWTGLLLLALFLLECVTLLSLRSMITVHIVVGAFLIPLVVLKTATTGWRIVRYYLGSPLYRQAGPPPLLLRLLGPLVVLAGVAVLGTGVALIALGRSTFTTIVAVGGVSIDALTLHQASFILWLAATGLHVLARAVPAAQLAAGTGAHSRRVPGSTVRLGLVVLTLAAGAAVSLLVLHYSGDWTGGSLAQHQRPGASAPA